MGQTRVRIHPASIFHIHIHCSNTVTVTEGKMHRHLTREIKEHKIKKMKKASS